jgi:hypothetical protein
MELPLHLHCTTDLHISLDDTSSTNVLKQTAIQESTLTARFSFLTAVTADRWLPECDVTQSSRGLSTFQWNVVPPSSV